MSTRLCFNTKSSNIVRDERVVLNYQGSLSVPVLFNVHRGFVVSFEMSGFKYGLSYFIQPTQMLSKYRGREEVRGYKARLSGRLADRWRSEGWDRNGSLEIFPSAVSP